MPTRLDEDVPPTVTLDKVIAGILQIHASFVRRAQSSTDLALLLFANATIDISPERLCVQ